MSELNHNSEGNVHEVDGDIVVPDTVDRVGWHVDADPNVLTKDELIAASVAARSIVGFGKKGDTANQLFDNSTFEDGPTEEEFEAVEDLDASDRVSPMVLKDRLHTILEERRFLVGETREATDIAALTMQSEDPKFKSAKFLSFIQRRQVRLNKEAIERNKELPKEEQVEVDPNQPRINVESIVGRYIRYARTSKSQVGLLLGLTDMITDQGAKRSRPASSVSILRDWTDDGSTRGPIIAMMKASDVEAFIYSSDTGPNPLRNTYKDLSESQIQAMGDEFIDSMTVGQLQDLIAQRAGEQRRRFEFWIKALEDSKANNAAYRSANSALESLVPKSKK